MTKHPDSSAPAGQLLIYQTEEGRLKVEARLEHETLWLTQQQMANLFQTSQQNISLHVQNVYEEGELRQEATHKDFLLVRQEGARQVSRQVAHYNLDVILSVGYRVKSAVVTRFRISEKSPTIWLAFAEAQYEQYNTTRIKQSDTLETDFERVIKQNYRLYLAGNPKARAKHEQ